MTVNAALLLLTLTGGYCFAVTWHPSLYRSARESGQRIYFRSAFYSFFSVVFAMEISIPFYLDGSLTSLLQLEDIEHGTPLINQLIYLWTNERYVNGILILSFLIGITFPAILNITFQVISSALPEKYSFDLFITKRAIRLNDFEKLIFRAAVTGTPILLTMSTGKVYAGWVVDAPNPSAQRRSIRILPILSGYRDKSDHRLNFTTSYYEILTSMSDGEQDLDHLEPIDFEVVLPVEKIYASHLFDITAYNRFQQITSSFVGPPAPDSNEAE
jgi:hypothetical protein